MALVDYSDSDASDSETTPAPPPKPTTTTTATTKIPFQKLIDRSGPGAGKILVNLPSTPASEDTPTPSDEPPAKRAKTTAGASRFSAFSSFLPAPKKNAPAAAIAKSGGSGSGSPAPGLGRGISLKTGAEASFVRGAAVSEGDEEDGGSGDKGGGLNLPVPKKGPTGPTIPEGQKPEEEVKLVGKPLMFKPLSVTRKAVKKKGVVGARVPTGGVTAVAAKVEAVVETAPPPPKKVSLFSMDDDDAPASKELEPTGGGGYEPLFGTDHAPAHDDYDDNNNGVTGDYESYAPPPTNDNNYNPTAQFHSASSIVDGLQLSAKDQRELFGRRGGANRNGNNDFALPANARVLNFNMEKEYEHNEVLRASGEQVYNPVRSIAPGKHSLRQMVNMAQNNQSALEDSFAQGRNNKRDAAGRYGWK
ncbi:mitotic checkpoint regulator, MAD2B-interacting-domain-containing protein [Cercophora newfieldiana]|uniref:Mitotic checkpoint regulator, MAD2B-interacting-domain-containing protein n=1 Tax=Cercophora newfieldiana TaxID=92897 RepID=A0AA40CQZ8_9PEZI|nr:mitotic checkpoint regulator, MAD2B-interacting-domain-containing protein [Cercophora newfieldiana]